MRLSPRRKGRDVTLDSSEGSRGRQAGSVLTHHQHKHTEEEGWRGDERERERGEEGGGGGGGGVLYKAPQSPSCSPDRLDKGQ